MISIERADIVDPIFSSKFRGNPFFDFSDACCLHWEMMNSAVLAIYLISEAVLRSKNKREKSDRDFRLSEIFNLIFGWHIFDSGDLNSGNNEILE